MNRCFISKNLIAFFIVQSLVSVAVASDSSGQEQIFNEFTASITSQKNIVENFPIDQQILALKKLSEHDAASARTEMQRLQQIGLELNQAEYYLLHLARANIANIKGQEHKVINWLNKAIKLESYLNEKQLNSPDFASAYLMLANIYHQQGLYQKAFDSKKKYIKKYASHLKLRNKLRVRRLNEKYQMAKKLEQNELLEQSGELKRLELARAESQRSKQNLNIAIILLAGLLFLLLLLRQFKIRRALKILAKTDDLTKLANRRAFFSNGYRYMEHALKAQSELCVLVISIDHFKQLNDKLGDDIGDDIICHVAGLASEAMRSRDILARIGGAEFAAILPDANIGQARSIAERIREKIQHCAKEGLKEESVSVSIGLASINDANDSFDDLLHLADMAMQQAKANGCNCLCNDLPTNTE
jgi:diguanylate cyclase (GGDEF)-like protein